MTEHKEVPTNRKVNLYCENCNEVSIFFMTNQEIFNNPAVKQHCTTCQKTTVFKNKKKIKTIKKIDKPIKVEKKMGDRYISVKCGDNDKIDKLLNALYLSYESTWDNDYEKVSFKLDSGKLLTFSEVNNPQTLIKFPEIFLGYVWGYLK